MKKTLYLISSVLFAVAVFSCNKDNPEEIGPEIITPGTPVTISLNIPAKGLTKVDLTQDADPDGPVKLTWEETDEITVKNAADESKSVVFEYESGAGTTTASFTAVDASALEGATSYNIYLSSGDAAATEQHQAGDGSTAHLGYSATLRGVNKLNGATFSSEWAEAAENGSGTFVSSSVLRLRVQLPSGVAATVQAVTFKADQDIFLSGKTLKVIIDTPGDAGSDGILNVYATLPGGAVIPAGTNLLFQFQVSADENDLLTAHRLITPANTFNEGKVNALKITCPNIQSYANQSTVSIGTISNPYLIGDRNQLAEITNLLSPTEKKYFKLVDDITVSSWSSIDTNEKGTINLNGNYKTLRGLTRPVFVYLDGEVSNLTISGAKVSSSGNYYGILARTINKGDCRISNVHIESSSITSTGHTVGGMIGRIDTGTSSCQITDCSVDATVTGGGASVGGLVGFISVSADITRCCTSGSVSSVGACGGFVGLLNGSGSINISKSYSTATFNPGGTSQSGGFVGSIEGSGSGTFSISDCYATGNLLTSNSYGCGGFVGKINKSAGTVSFERCYATGTINIKYGYSRGGFAGRIEVSNISIINCAAWNSAIRGQNTIANWSAGAVVGVAHPLCTLTDNYRNPSMTLHAYWGTSGQTYDLSTDYQHRNVSSSQPLMIINSDGTVTETSKTSLDTSDGSGIFAYQGKCVAGKTLSWLANSSDYLNWGSSVWNYDEDLPRLKWTL